MTDLPELCYVMIGAAQPGERIGIIKRNERGYYLTDFDNKTASDTIVQEAVRRMNERLGVKPSQVIAMQAGSMFGWDVPGANPAEWESADVVISSSPVMGQFSARSAT